MPVLFKWVHFTFTFYILTVVVILALVICAACKNHEEFKGQPPCDYNRRPSSNPYA
ncbi:uncharacterized protein LOC120453318 [Drosophila santomea]|uniref:uncharacterized protein LOC120453318 n=1 Tax=Drosophila santomea TaxID=129105 RepID=UPI0019547B5A|nr:uncharacterized protein LOC120453318 [Drosophila santomea]